MINTFNHFFLNVDHLLVILLDKFSGERNDKLLCLSEHASSAIKIISISDDTIQKIICINKNKCTLSTQVDPCLILRYHLSLHFIFYEFVIVIIIVYFL